MEEFKWIRELDDKEIDNYVRKTERMLVNLYPEDEGRAKEVMDLNTL